MAFETQSGETFACLPLTTGGSPTILGALRLAVTAHSSIPAWYMVFSPCVSVPVPPLLRTAYILNQGSNDPDDLILNLITLAKTLFPNKVAFTEPGV